VIEPADRRASFDFVLKSRVLSMQCSDRDQAYTACMQQLKNRTTNLTVAMADPVHESNVRLGRGSRNKHRRPVAFQAVI